MGEANQGEDGALQEHALRLLSCYAAWLRVEKGLGFSQPRRTEAGQGDTHEAIVRCNCFFKRSSKPLLTT